MVNKSAKKPILPEIVFIYRLPFTTIIVKRKLNMDSENSFFKTAELVRDTLGCYYFICLQCGKYFENLEDTVDHIEKYFYDSSDDSELLMPLANSEPDYVNDDDVDTLVTNIKKESFEEYEDYKLSIPQLWQDDGQSASVYCPICALDFNENSLTSHLMKVHHRSRKNAKIYECKDCGRNTFTRSHDLQRHKLIHARHNGASASISGASDVNSNCKDESTENSVLFNILSQSDKEAVSETYKDCSVNEPLIQISVKSTRKIQKRKIFEPDIIVQPAQKRKKSLEVIKNEKPLDKNNFCAICQDSFPETESLEAHLIRVHHRHKQYAQIYECTICGKNTFTRPYDLRRHELIHARNDNSVMPDASKIKAETPSARKNSATFGKRFNSPPTIKDKKVINKVPLTKKTEVLSNADISKISEEIHTTNPKKNGILCAICNKKFGSYLEVTMHLKFEHNQKRIYKCTHLNCSQDSFTSAFALHRHEISHSVHYRNATYNNKNRMKCVFCRRSFNKRWNLMKHEKRHLLEESK